jgi:hypothetical protein
MTSVEAEVEYSRKAAALMNSRLVARLPEDQQWALRDVLAEHSTIESLPPHVKRLFDDSIHSRVTEAKYEERLHPRGRSGKWVKKPFTHMGKSFDEHHHESGYSVVPVFEPDMTKWKPTWNTLSREEQQAKLRTLPLRTAPEGYRVLDPEGNSFRGGYMATLTSAKRLAEKRATPDATGPGALLQGAGTRGKQGRKSPAKGKAKGWRERIEELRAEPVITQNALMLQRRRALATRDDPLPWTPINGDWQNGYEQGGDRRLIPKGGPFLGGTDYPGYDVYYRGEHIAWVPALPGETAQARFNQAFHKVGRENPPANEDAERFLGEWWGAPGYPGKFQRMSGDPGLMFEEQHERIMEAGAHLDAETNRRLDAKGGIVKRVKQLERDQRDYTKWRKEAEKAEEDAAFEAIAKWLVDRQGYDPDLMTAQRAKERFLAFEKERRKPSQRRKEIADGWDVSEAYERRFNLAEQVGIDLQGLYDKSYEARMRELRGAGDLGAARAVLKEARRDMFYDVLAEVRELAKPGDLELEPNSDFTRRDHVNDPDVESYNSNFVAAPKLERAALWLPRDWVRSSNEHPSRLVPGWARRGYYGSGREDSEGAEVALIVGSPSPEALGVEKGVGTMVHELVHRVEHVRDGVKGAEWTFYAARVSPGTNRAWEQPRKLSELTGVGGYEDHEVARQDHFVKAYSGKSYGDDPDSSYEVLTMGVQDLVTGEHGTIEQDDEYRHFVFGALALL